MLAKFTNFAQQIDTKDPFSNESYCQGEITTNQGPSAKCL